MKILTSNNSNIKSFIDYNLRHGNYTMITIELDNNRVVGMTDITFYDFWTRDLSRFTVKCYRKSKLIDTIIKEEE